MLTPELDDHFHDECGVVGIFNNPNASYMVHLALFALQHRGQEAFGIATIEPGGQLHIIKRSGLVADGCMGHDLAQLPGGVGIGHVRYSTQGGQSMQNIQPMVFTSHNLGSLAIAHNGNLTNDSIIRRELEHTGSVFSSTSDSELFLHLLAKSHQTSLVGRIQDTMQLVHGGYAVILAAKDQLIAFRDPFGIRPLVLGKKEETYLVASETCALDLLDAVYLRDIEPGEIAVIDSLGIKSYVFDTPLRQKQAPAGAFCSFEEIYFARPDSLIAGESVYQIRRRIGEALAREAAVAADMVIGVPDSGIPMAMGYASASHIPFEMGLIRNHYVGRTFIEPSPSIRDLGVKLKLNSVPHLLKDKRVIVVDDSLVRGTTSKKMVRLLRQAGAKEVHLRIGSPPVTHSCFYGVDTPERSQLLAAQYNQAEISHMLQADSIAYLSLEAFKEALPKKLGHCFACFTGLYPEAIFTPVPKQPTD